ncbi:MAG: iron chelate uptake ABC transporter family permease subunit, partial [bacterium]
MTLLLVAAMAICSLFGAVDFEWEEIMDSPIFWQLRVPRVVMSVLVGAVLSVCGAAYQSIFRNPLTDPYVLGVSSGASLGAAVALL